MVKVHSFHSASGSGKPIPSKGVSGTNTEVVKSEELFSRRAHIYILKNTV